MAQSTIPQPRARVLVDEKANVFEKVWYRFFDRINTVLTGVALVASANTFAAKNTFDKGFLLGSETYEIDTGEITLTGFGRVFVDTEGGGAADDLDTIGDGQDGAVIVVSSVSAARVVTVKDATGNLTTAGDFVLDSPRDTITLIYGDNLWREMARSDNA